MLDIILKFYNDLTKFRSTEPIWVTYDESTHVLTYRQLNYVYSFAYLSHLFLPGKLTVGVLNQDGFSTLMGQLRSLIESGILDDKKLVASPEKFGIKLYYSFKGVPGPQVVQELELISIRNRFIAGQVMKRYSPESRTLYKILKDERKKQNKGNQQQ